MGTPHTSCCLAFCSNIHQTAFQHGMFRSHTAPEAGHTPDDPEGEPAACPDGLERSAQLRRGRPGAKVSHSLEFRVGISVSTQCGSSELIPSRKAL